MDPDITGWAKDSSLVDLTGWMISGQTSLNQMNKQLWQDKLQAFRTGFRKVKGTVSGRMAGTQKFCLSTPSEMTYGNVF